MAGRKSDQGSKEKIAKVMDEAGRGEVGKAGGEAGKGEHGHGADPGKLAQGMDEAGRGKVGKAKRGSRYGDPVEMVGPEKQRRLRRAAEAWLAAHPELAGLETSFEVVAIADGRLERIRQAF